MAKKMLTKKRLLELIKNEKMTTEERTYLEALVNLEITPFDDEHVLTELEKSRLVKEILRYNLTIKSIDSITHNYMPHKYKLEIMPMVGFLDGINDSLVTPNPIETMEEDTVVSLKFDKEKLYKNMIDAKADWLYGLPHWEKIFDEEQLKALTKEAKNMHTIVRTEKKVGRNDPCPCGSGKKYKHCCMNKK